MTGRGVFRIRDCIGNVGVQAGLPDGRWVRAVPERFDAPLTRHMSAWEVICGRAVAMEWPKPGDLENALKDRSS